VTYVQSVFDQTGISSLWQQLPSPRVWECVQRIVISFIRVRYAFEFFSHSLPWLVTTVDEWENSHAIGLVNEQANHAKFAVLQNLQKLCISIKCKQYIATLEIYLTTGDSRNNALNLCWLSLSLYILHAQSDSHFSMQNNVRHQQSSRRKNPLLLIGPLLYSFLTASIEILYFSNVPQFNPLNFYQCLLKLNCWSQLNMTSISILLYIISVSKNKRSEHISVIKCPISSDSTSCIHNDQWVTTETCTSQYAALLHLPALTPYISISS
jgi:hypothetical protein